MRNDSGDSTSNRSMTDWSMVLDAGQVESPTQAASLDELVRKYWTPLYAFVRASGQSPEDTHDIVQGFIADVLLSRNLLAHADPERGRFRNLLFRSISNYIRDRHRKATSTLRRPKDGGIRSLDETESFYQAVDRNLDPERAFITHWVATVIRNAIGVCRSDLEGRGRSAEWAILESRVVKPMLDGAEPAPYHELVARLELRDASQAANMLVLAKRSFAKAVFDEIGETILDREEVTGEIHELLRLLQRGGVT